jgi:inner membrane protein
LSLPIAGEPGGRSIAFLVKIFQSMATLIGHAAVALTAGKLYTGDREVPRRFWDGAILVSILPDLDVLGFRLGIAYGDLLGHRGFMHSILFALLSAIAAAWAVTRKGPPLVNRWAIAFLYALIAVSHPVLDAMTDGGLGIAFLSPFNETRYFLPWQPLHVSPIGGAFFSPEGLTVLWNEFLWLGVPCLALLSASFIGRSRRR